MKKTYIAPCSFSICMQTENQLLSGSIIENTGTAEFKESVEFESNSKNWDSPAWEEK